ncbi:UNVERIFIED_CONTAM: Dolichol kinase EVAN [Sesamum calycinum]|uniref:dolichol kinase n=1 Tax=Sesamum calycinum TaxID=2727403 RepID=A0AAW2SEG2_9LAMI
MAVSLLQQLNGERAVVLLYIIPILFSTPISLLPEACSLSLLSLFALCVEISVDDASNPLANYFRTRLACSLDDIVGALSRIHSSTINSENYPHFPRVCFYWVFHFVFSEPFKSLTLCAYWLVVIYFSVRKFYNISKNSKTERILLRKYYHLMAVSIFVPALIFQIWKIWPLGHLVHQFMNAFTDHRDSDLLIVSHFSLLLGCALPIWLSSGFSDRPLAPFAGILSLGIGDTMASMVGHKYGVLRWSKTGKKTIEGTAAGITSVLAACFILLPLLAATGYIFTLQWFSLIVAVTISGLLEAYTAQLDNAFIPLVFYSLLCL